MEKTATLNLRVNPGLKQRAESVLNQLGIPMSTAIDMYLNQICLTGGIPFNVTLPKAPATVNADMMSDEKIHSLLAAGMAEIDQAQDAAEVFAEFRKRHL